MSASEASPRRVLVVVRDTAHARDDVAPVWTLRELFDRLIAWALLADGGVRDNRAALWATAEALAQGGALLPRIAHDADDLRRALLHGGASAAEVARALDDGDSGRAGELATLFATLAAAERRLAAAERVDGAAALARAVQMLERGEVPAALRAFDAVEVRELVEPSDLELRALVALARGGISVRASVPIDSLGRGLLAGVEPVLRALEAADDADLELELVDVAEGARADGTSGFARAWYGGGVAPGASVEVALCADEAAEARDIASVVAAWRRERPGARVAVALRTVDDGAARIADALSAHGTPVRIGRRTLLAAPAARLLLDVVALARDGAPRDRLVAVLASPALTGALSSAEGARVLRVLRLAAARTDVEDAQRPRGGYRHRLERYRSGLELEQERHEVDVALGHVERALGFAARLPKEATLLQHLEALRAVAGVIFEDGDRLGCADVVDLLDESLRACAAVAGDAGDRVALAAVATLLERALERAPGPAPAVDADDAVEILALPELVGRALDHVVIAGCVEGRLPRTERKERLLADADRALVNKALGRRALRLIDDDPLEPSPVARAQALEPLWFLGAVRAAGRSLLLSAPRRDGRGRELSPSVFLLESERALAGQGARFAREPSPRAVAVRAAGLRAGGALDDDHARALGLSPGLVAHIDLCKRIADERARFFFHKGSRPLSAVRAPFAFAVDPERISTTFAGSFGLSAARPLTPTRLEALASCRMHGFLQHVLKVDVDAPAGNAADARVIGTLAHAVMERFFRERKARNVPASRVTDADRERVRALLAEEAAPVIAFRATGHLGAIRAQIEWLETALVRAVSMLARDPRVGGVEPVDFEVAVGVGEGALPASSLEVGGRTLWLGGVIDRIDEGAGARAVIDYKTSSTGAIRRKARVDALFEKHFQLLLYLRILEAHRPTPEGTSLHGYLVSLRDGTTSSDVAEVPDLRARVLDDAREDGLAAGVGRVVLPVLEGTLPPDAGDRCDTCRLQRICRIPLAPEFAPDIDDVDEGSGV